MFYKVGGGYDLCGNSESNTSTSEQVLWFTAPWKGRFLYETMLSFRVGNDWFNRMMNSLATELYLTSCCKIKCLSFWCRYIVGLNLRIIIYILQASSNHSIIPSTFSNANMRMTERQLRFEAYFPTNLLCCLFQVKRHMKHNLLSTTLSLSLSLTVCIFCNGYTHVLIAKISEQTNIGRTRNWHLNEEISNV